MPPSKSLSNGGSDCVSTGTSLFDVRPHLRPARPEDPVCVLGNLDLTFTSITHLPERLSVRGHLFLQHAPLVHLPNRLSVGGDLYLQHTTITRLPACMSVQGEILPPETLIDLLQFRATLTHRLRLHRAGLSAHALTDIFRRLAPYPDVLRVWQSTHPDSGWCIFPLGSEATTGI